MLMHQRWTGIDFLTWFNFNPSMDKWWNAQFSVGWNYWSICTLQRLHRWSLGMDIVTSFHPTVYNGRNYLIHVSKRGHRNVLLISSCPLNVWWQTAIKIRLNSIPIVRWLRPFVFQTQYEIRSYMIMLLYAKFLSPWFHYHYFPYKDEILVGLLWCI